MDTDYIKLLREHQDKFLIPGELLNKGGPKDYVGMTVALTGTLFFQGSHLPETRKRIVECFEEWRALAHDHLRWLWVEGLEGPVPYAKAPPFVDIIKEEPSLSLGYFSGEKSFDASQWHFQIQGLQDWQAKMGSWGLEALRFSIPLLTHEEHPRKFVELFVHFCQRLRVKHGLGGHGFVLSPTRASENSPAEAYFADRMRGAEAGSMIAMLQSAKTGIKSVSWLTALGTELLDKVGGVDDLRLDLPPAWYAFYDYGAGVVVQAGNEPDIAATEDEPMPPLYVLLNAALREVRAPKIGRFHQKLDGDRRTLATAETAAWLARFDTNDLTTFQQRLQSVPKLRPEHRLPAED